MKIKELIRKAGIRSNRKDINLSGFTEQCSQWLTSPLNAVRKLRKLGKLGGDFGGLKTMKDGSIHYIAGKIKSRNVSQNVVFLCQGGHQGFVSEVKR